MFISGREKRVACAAIAKVRNGTVIFVVRIIDVLNEMKICDVFERRMFE